MGEGAGEGVSGIWRIIWVKGSYEDSVWDHLAGTVSEPFAGGEHNRIAVKVIDDRGNELMVVKSLDEAGE
jgi:adenine-specific DNA-methyltransferase